MQADRSGVPPASARQSAPEIKLPGAPSREPGTAVATDVETTTHIPARLGAHELVLLHGQPDAAADWLQATGRLWQSLRLARLHAGRRGSGTPEIPGSGWLELSPYACLVLHPGDLIGQVAGQRGAAGAPAPPRQGRWPPAVLQLQTQAGPPSDPPAHPASHSRPTL